MNVLVGCEYSGTVRDAFIARGHNAVSVDLLPTETHGPHVQGDVLAYARMHARYFDLAIMFPPCTHLAVSGARYFYRKQTEQRAALRFVLDLMNLPIPRIAIENPVSVISTRIAKPAQYVQPWQYGHGETKKTGLWLKGLPLLQATDLVDGREQRIHLMSPGPNRAKERSKTYKGIADAMADQWGNAPITDRQFNFVERINA